LQGADSSAALSHQHRLIGVRKKLGFSDQEIGDAFGWPRHEVKTKFEELRKVVTRRRAHLTND
jgi:hypothetical protein